MLEELASTKNTIIFFVCPPKILHKHCLYFLLGLTMISKETGNNVYAKFWVDKQSIMVFFVLANKQGRERNNRKSHHKNIEQ